MRVVALVLAFTALAPLARADEKMDCRKDAAGVLRCSPVKVNGEVQRPRAIYVIPRDQSVKQAIDSSTDEHLKTVSDRR